MNLKHWYIFFQREFMFFIFIFILIFIFIIILNQFDYITQVKELCPSETKLKNIVKSEANALKYVDCLFVLLVDFFCLLLFSFSSAFALILFSCYFSTVYAYFVLLYFSQCFSNVQVLKRIHCTVFGVEDNKAVKCTNKANEEMLLKKAFASNYEKFMK